VGQERGKDGNKKYIQEYQEIYWWCRDEFFKKKDREKKKKKKERQGEWKMIQIWKKAREIETESGKVQ
jgi:hypothetical protein